MPLLKNPGRNAGLLYLLGSIPGFFGLLYVPGRIIVHGDATATAANLATHETLFRLGIAANFAGQVIFIYVARALYHLFATINRRHALSMLILLMLSIPIAFLNELNGIAAILLVRGSAFLGLFDQPHRNALAMFFLNLHGYGFDVAGILWGLWLLPMGLLVYRSGYLPRLLGIFLVIGCFAYLTNSFMGLIFPAQQSAVARWTSPLQLVEMVFMAWLLIQGSPPAQLIAEPMNRTS